LPGAGLLFMRLVAGIALVIRAVAILCGGPSPDFSLARLQSKSGQENRAYKSEINELRLRYGRQAD
jgi:hypothetical protein